MQDRLVAAPTLAVGLEQDGGDLRAEANHSIEGLTLWTSAPFTRYSTGTTLGGRQTTRSELCGSAPCLAP